MHPALQGYAGTNANKNMKHVDHTIRTYYAAQRLPDERVAHILAAARAAKPPRVIHRRQPQWLAAAAALVILLGGAALWRVPPVYAAGRVAAEVARTHLKAHDPDVQGDCFDRVGKELDVLDFPLKPSPEFAFPEGLKVVGGRYCSLRGEPAAQILLVDAKGRRCTVVVALATDTRLARVRDGEYECDGVRVRIWHDAGRLFAMAV
jgi:hypothetical protein